MELSKEFTEHFRKETDRAAAVLGGEFISEKMSKFLQHIMRNPDKELFSGMGLCATFSSRAHLLFQFNAISSYEHGEITIVRKIRNEFAHSADYQIGFNSNKIKTLTYELKWPNIIVKLGNLGDGKEVEEILSTPRRRFEVSVGAIAHVLDRRQKEWIKSDAIDDTMARMYDLIPKNGRA